MKIVAMMRVKNEARWLAEVIQSIQPLTREIYVFDDHSTDETPAIASAHDCSVIHSPFPDKLDEVRDKNYLLHLVRQVLPDYVLSIDGDEVLEAHSADRIRRRLEPKYSLYQLSIKYVWNDRQHYRADGVYGRYNQWRLFSLVNQNGRVHFPVSKAGGNFHCGNTPLGLVGPGAAIPVDILHLGYMDREDRIRKYEWYNAPDKQPIPAAEDGYKHMVIGDLFDAKSKFVHGGPLKIFTLPASKWPQGDEALATNEREQFGPRLAALGRLKSM